MLSTPYHPQLSPSHAVAPICLGRKPNTSARLPAMVASPLSSPSLFGSSWDEDACSSPRASHSLRSPALSPRLDLAPISYSSPDAFGAKHPPSLRTIPSSSPARSPSLLGSSWDEEAHRN